MSEAERRVAHIPSIILNCGTLIARLHTLLVERLGAEIQVHVDVLAEVRCTTTL